MARAQGRTSDGVLGGRKMEEVIGPPSYAEVALDLLEEDSRQRNYYFALGKKLLLLSQYSIHAYYEGVETNLSL